MSGQILCGQFDTFVSLCNTAELDKACKGETLSHTTAPLHSCCNLEQASGRVFFFFKLQKYLYALFGCLGWRGLNYGIGSLSHLLDRCSVDTHGWDSDSEIRFLIKLVWNSKLVLNVYLCSIRLRDRVIILRGDSFKIIFEVEWETCWVS